MSKRTAISLGAILFAHLALLLITAKRNSAGFDEGAHLSAGLAQLRYGEMSIYNLSPPLLSMWAAAPAYFGGAQIPPPQPMRGISANQRHWAYFDEFQEKNLPRLAEFIFWGRLMCIPFSLAGGLLIFFWAKHLYGEAAALAACCVWCFSPTVIGFGSALGTDVQTAVAMLAACGAWLKFLHGGSKRWAIGAAFIIAMAQAMKFTALALWPILLLIAIYEIAMKRARRRDGLAGGAIAIVIWFCVINGFYGFRLMGERLGTFHFRSQMMLTMQRILPGALPVPFSRTMIEGFDAQKWETQAVNVTALFGEGYFGSDWRYYPWLVLCETTVGGLVLLALAAASFWWKRPSDDEIPLLILLLSLAIGIALGTDINKGIRYLLPLYLPAIILMGRCITLPRMKGIVLAAVLAAMVEAAWATPRFVSFCNVIARPWRADVPELDWGQSLIELREWMAARGEKKIDLLYRGTADPLAYGVSGTDPFSPPTTRYVAISRALLEGIPVRIRQGFVFVRPWRELLTIKPQAELGGLLVYRSEQIPMTDEKFWVVLVTDWNQASREPTLIKIRNLQERLSIGN